MGLRFACARAVGVASTWGLKRVFHRPAENFPGKIALYLDPHFIGDLRGKLAKGSIAVVGTNGKTTVTNLIADALEKSGLRVVCNRSGANLDSGVATALLHAGASDWGVFECDELWLAKVLPQLQADYVLLLNLFRDQLDRVGEIDRVQDSIVEALALSPDTVLVYNADDPLCAMIAERAAELPGRSETPSVAFGVSEDMALAQNTVVDAQMCQRCSTMFEYAYRQYGQLGEYRCPNCGFSRPPLDYAAESVRLSAKGLAFSLAKQSPARRFGIDSDDAAAGSLRAGAARAVAPAAGGPAAGAVAAPSDAPSGACAAAEGAPGQEVHAPFNGAYMVYNLAAVAAAADLAGCPAQAVQRAIDEFDPRNGRLQEFFVAGRRILLNLAKNPTGFNQNLKIVAQDAGAKAVAFFINDKEADGRDVSWLWDIDFEELAESGAAAVFAGGLRAADMQVRLKYAGFEAEVVADAEDLLARLAQRPQGESAYLIANYTALPAAKAALEAAARSSDAGHPPSPAGASPEGPFGDPSRLRAVDAAPGPLAPEANRPPARSGDSASVATDSAALAASASCAAPAPAAEGGPGGGQPPVVIAHLFPDLLNLYGDGGNVRVLEQRLRWRGLPVEVRCVRHGEEVDLACVDVVFMGGGPDREQRLASEDLMRMKDDLRAYVEDGGVLLAICGGYQILGREWLSGGKAVEGLGIIDVVTGRAAGDAANRLIDDIVLDSPLAQSPVVGYENHAGRTHLGAGLEPFGKVISSTGHGNNDTDGQDGVRYRNVVGTYLHGPLLSKNPEVADHLLRLALARRAARTGAPALGLAPLDDAAERAANEQLSKRFGAK